MSSKFNFDAYETLKNEEKKEVEKVMENKVEAIESNEPKDEKEIIIDGLFDKIKKELDFNEYRIWKSIHKEMEDKMSILMERITDLENKIK